MSLVDMQGKVAMMTGGARGIGRGIITTLTGAGASVAIAVMCPGHTQTPLVEEMQQQEFGSRVLGRMEQYVPLRTLGQT
jgi:NAD(P)-dependent dehydrogenase (short-subunit alcohol dehydrogenase family)